MRIAYLVSAYPAVSHTFIRREIEAIRRRGAEVSTFSVRRADPSGLNLESDLREAERTRSILPVGPFTLGHDHILALASRPIAYLRTFARSRRHRLPGMRGWLWAWFHFAEAIRLARLLASANVSHLHVHFANNGSTLGLLAASYLGLRWSMTLHGRADFSYPAVALLPDKMRRARFVACVSHFGRASALSYADPGVSDDKLFVVRCGLDGRALTPTSESPKTIPRTRTRILSVGRLSLEKAQVGLLEAFAKLLREGIDAELEIVGEGVERARLEERIAELELEDRCRLAGALPETEVFERIQSADIFALSSLVEGLPVSLMEAMALGIPVVAPRLAGIPELVEDGETGLLFHPADWSGLAGCLRRLTEDASLRSLLVVKAREKVAQEFDIDLSVEALWLRFVEEEDRDLRSREMKSRRP
ncbi:MAG: glycosyltransferase family 4 protein [bacterium]|nr:glycosyltransferase family 4 protein [bacterium]